MFLKDGILFTGCFWEKHPNKSHLVFMNPLRCTFKNTLKKSVKFSHNKDDHILKDLDQTECWDNWTFFIPTVYKMQDLIIHSFLSVWVKTLKGLQNLHFRLANRVFFIDLIYFKLFTHFKRSRTLLLKLSGWNLYSFI